MPEHLKKFSLQTSSRLPRILSDQVNRSRPTLGPWNWVDNRLLIHLPWGHKLNHTFMSGQLGKVLVAPIPRKAVPSLTSDNEGRESAEN